MSIPMTIEAALAIIALLGLIIALIAVASVVNGLITSGKRAAKMVERPTNTALQIVETGKGIAEKSVGRATAISGHVKSVAASAKRLKKDLATAADASTPKTPKVDIKASADKAAEAVRQAGASVKDTASDIA